MENKSIPDMLDRLAEILQQNDSLQQVYLDSVQEKDQVIDSATPAGQLRLGEGKLPEFLKQLGIRSITLNDTAGIVTLLSTASYMARQVGSTPHNYFHTLPLPDTSKPFSNTLLPLPLQIGPFSPTHPITGTNCLQK